VEAVDLDLVGRAADVTALRKMQTTSAKRLSSSRSRLAPTALGRFQHVSSGTKPSSRKIARFEVLLLGQSVHEDAARTRADSLSLLGVSLLLGRDLRPREARRSSSTC
jgi:hypothetical protein